MTDDTPYLWLSRVAADTPDRLCLVDGIASFTYRDILELVDVRADELAIQITEWEIVPVPVRIDVDSIVAILAIQRAGGVPLPHIGHSPVLPVSTAPEVAVCVETSGSSGTRKIVPLTFENVRAAVHASQKRMNNTSEDRWLLCLPLNHVGGLSIVWRTLEAGGTAIVVPFDAIGTTIERLSPTIASMVPTMVQRLADNNIEVLASISSVLVGGAALGAPLWERCIRSGVTLLSTYGLTEAGSQVATTAAGESNISPGFVGRPLDAIEVVIVGTEHQPLPIGEIGLISIAGTAVFDGYLGEEAHDGLFVTNDVGRIDAEGNLHVEGRSDDVVVSGGENVSLNRVSALIGGIDGVDEVCVVGIENDEWGTIGAAMMVSGLELELFDTMVEEVLMPHERPKRWLKVDIIPTLANGKHDLAAVREAFKEEQWT